MSEQQEHLLCIGGPADGRWVPDYGRHYRHAVPNEGITDYREVKLAVADTPTSGAVRRIYVWRYLDNFKAEDQLRQMLLSAWIRGKALEPTIAA